MIFQFESFNDFLLMDGHGAYVWASYVITAIALKLLVWVPYSKRRELVVQFVRQQRIDSSQSTHNID